MIKKFLGKYGFFFFTILLLLAGYLYVVAVGDTYTVRTQMPYMSAEERERLERSGEDYQIFVESDSIGSVEILGFTDLGNELEIKVRSERTGRVYLSFWRGEVHGLKVLYVHENGVITKDDYFGDCNGSKVLCLVWILYLAFLTEGLYVKYRRSIRKNRYLYRNILYCGLILFMIYIFLFQMMELFDERGAIGILEKLMSSLTFFGTFLFLPVVIAFIMVTISNIELLRKEGKSWRNLLGAILGIVMTIACMMPMIIGEFFQTTNLIDVHNWRGTGRFVGMFVENFFGFVVAYLNCILLGTIILSIMAARHVPAFDKDYVIIHGCMIRKDGTLTKLLQSRADRALEFDGMQKKATGKELIFVPSGGKGEDEIISEAEAVSRYLQEKGISKERILLEDQSKNTEENIVNSVRLIREREGGAEAKIALSTTNYHVFRAGLIASGHGVMIEGIGSGTKSYFWINAFVREFIATLVSERRTHIAVLAILTGIDLLMVIMTYVSNVVLS